MKKGKATDSTSDQARPDRTDQKLLAGFVDSDTHRAFKILAAKEKLSTVALMHEAVAHLLACHGEPLPKSLREYLRVRGRPIPTHRLGGHRPA